MIAAKRTKMGSLAKLPMRLVRQGGYRHQFCIADESSMPDSAGLSTHKLCGSKGALLRSNSSWNKVHMSIHLSLRNSALGLCLAVLTSTGAQAFEPPVFPLNDAQMKALEEYALAKTEKAFAAGPEGQFSVQTGFISATIAAREAIKACDQSVSDSTKRCILIDLNGERLPDAVQMAQLLRIDPGLLEKPTPVSDLVLDIDAWRAKEGYRDKTEHKAFAISLKGPWARSWEGNTPEEAEKEALASCNRNEAAKTAPCFILMRDGVTVPSSELRANPDLSVDGQKPQ